MKKIVGYIVCALIVFFLAFFELFDTFDTTIEDNIYHVPNGVNNKIRIIKIDDKTMNKYGDISGWDRDMYTNLVDILCASEDEKPVIIGFDVLFSSVKDEKTDKNFAEICDKYDNVVCGFSYTFTSEVVVDKEGYLISDTMVVDEKVVPYKELEEATSQGFVNAIIDDKTNKVRSAFLYYDEGAGKRTKSFIYNNYKFGCKCNKVGYRFCFI